MPYAIIMAGGPGERFWPLTHSAFPKYRIRFEANQSLLEKTYARLRKVYPLKNIYVVTTREQLPLIRKELPALSKERVIIEPHDKNKNGVWLLIDITIQPRDVFGFGKEHCEVAHLFQ